MTNRMRLANTTAIALGLSVLGGMVLAQEDMQVEGHVDLGQVIVGYTADGTPVYAGENTTEIDSEELHDTGINTSLDNTLRSETSVFTQEDPGNPALAVNIRGFEGSGRVAMMVDGVPQNYRTTGHAAQSAAYIDPNLLSSIDISRGAVVTAGGSGLAGAVNFRTLNAEDVLLDGRNFGGMTRLSYGDNGDDGAGMLAGAYRDETFDMVLAFSGQDASNYEDGTGATAANTWKDTRSGLLKLGYNLTDTQRVTFSAKRYEADFFATSYKQNIEQDTFTFGYSFNPGNNLVNLDFNLYYNETDIRYVAGTGSFVGRNMVTETLGGNLTNISDFQLGAWNVTSVNGLDYSQDDLGGGGGGVNPTNGTAKRFSAFSENVFVNGNWEVTFGLRANHYSLEGNASQGAIDVDYTSIDPKLTVAYWVNDWLQPYATLSQSSRMPTLQETMLGGTHPGGGMGMIANPLLEPETSRGYELGFNIQRHNLFMTGDRLTGRVNYYHMDVEDYVTASSLAGNFTNAWGQTGIAFVNQPGTAETSGYELELDYSTPRYDIGLSYTINDSDMPSQTPGLGAGQYLPDQTGSLRIATRFLNDKLTLGGQYNYVSGGLYTGLYQQTPTQTDSDYHLFDLFAVYDISEGAKLTAKVANVFDEDYTPWLSAGTKGRGRTAYVGLEMKF
ncbi:TonB-dependent receptor domain-containing protein [Roseovarius sp. MMSF_3281]|uniref:TonB-dependent receptor domain-containing protein n=1 Tax=Roseovarius sp. MMSF_3281 TaxID=3046694 RepID=UPI00273D041B|nr:TonB-dependent receptor [Roseovarius sp. MMSF_3281]